MDFNNKGLVENKKIIDLNNMNDVKYVKKITQKEFDQDNVIYNIFSSLREKINAPARNRNQNLISVLLLQQVIIKQQYLLS